MGLGNKTAVKSLDKKDTPQDDEFSGMHGDEMMDEAEDSSDDGMEEDVAGMALVPFERLMTTQRQVRASQCCRALPSFPMISRWAQSWRVGFPTHTIRDLWVRY